MSRNEKILKYLNSKCNKIFGRKLNSYIKPLEFKEIKRTGVTKYNPKTDEAFTLNSPITGYVKVTEPGKKDVESNAVWRGLISYVAASQLEIQKDDTLFIATTYALINEGLRELTKELGPLDYREITLGFPNGTYFKDQENYAAFEFRIHVK